MTLMLVCALCAATTDERVAAQLGHDAPSLAEQLQLDGSAARPFAALSVPLADHSGHDGGSEARISPMWIMMGLMMVGMMVALGVYMMRGSGGNGFETSTVPSPHLAAIPLSVAGAIRPGG